MLASPRLSLYNARLQSLFHLVAVPIGHSRPRDPPFVRYRRGSVENGRTRLWGRRCTLRLAGIQFERIQHHTEGCELELTLRADSTSIRCSLSLMMLFSLTPLAAARQNAATTPKSWSGILVSSACNADEAFAESPECTKIV